MDFNDEAKAILSSCNITSYETDEQAYIELQRFFRHWFGVVVVIFHGHWRAKQQNGMIVCPDQEELTISDMLQWYC